MFCIVLLQDQARSIMFLLLRPLVQDPRFCQDTGDHFTTVVVGGGGGENKIIEVKHCDNSLWVSVVEVIVMVYVMYVLVVYKGSMLLYVSMARVLRNAFAAWNQWAEDMFQHVGTVTPMSLC